MEFERQTEEDGPVVVNAFQGSLDLNFKDRKPVFLSWDEAHALKELLEEAINWAQKTYWPATD